MFLVVALRLQNRCINCNASAELSCIANRDKRTTIRAMNTTTTQKTKPKRVRMESQVIARVSAAQRETWDRIGGSEWLRVMLDALQKPRNSA